MALRDDTRCLTQEVLVRLASDPDWVTKYPPILTVDQAANLVIVSKHTIYAWSSEGKLARCSNKSSGVLRILRDKFLLQFFNGEMDEK